MRQSGTQSSLSLTPRVPPNFSHSLAPLCNRAQSFANRHFLSIAALCKSLLEQLVTLLTSLVFSSILIATKPN